MKNLRLTKVSGWLLLTVSLPLFAMGGQEGHGGDPDWFRFHRRAQFGLDQLKTRGLVEARLVTIYETAFNELRFEITDEKLPTTGRVVDDPLRPGKKWVRVERAKFDQMFLSPSEGNNITLFVIHELFETQGLDIHKEITQNLTITEADFRSWESGTGSLRADLLDAWHTYQQIVGFIKVFAVEVTAEQNLLQKGELNGSITGEVHGSLHGLQIGNVPGLARGILDLGSVATSSVFFPAPATLLSSGLTQVLSGLVGWGYGVGSLSGSIHGEVHGEFVGRGYQIHDEPSLFLVLTKDSKTFAPIVSLLQTSVKEGWYNAGLAKDLLQILQSPYFVSADDVTRFQSAVSTLESTFYRIDEKLIEHVGSDDSLCRDVSARVAQMKAWLRSKRLLFAQVLPSPWDLRFQSDQVNAVTVTRPTNKELEEMELRSGRYYQVCRLPLPKKLRVYNRNRVEDYGECLNLSEWKQEYLFDEVAPGENVFQTRAPLKDFVLMEWRDVWAEKRGFPTRFDRLFKVERSVPQGFPLAYHGALIHSVGELFAPERLGLREVRLSLGQ